MSPRIATSMVLLSALLAGTLSPIALCALVCERHSRADAHHHCGQDSDPMPGMAHDHPAMHHTGVGDVTLVALAQSCRTDCAVAERLNVLRKVVPQVTVVQTGAVGLCATSKFSAPHVESQWSVDSSPPSSPSAYTSSYSILRI
jgi:hypothetical protein